MQIRFILFSILFLDFSTHFLVNYPDFDLGKITWQRLNG